MKWMAKNELGRKMVHLLGGLIIIFGYTVVMEAWTAKVALMGMVFVLVIILILDYFRLQLNAPVGLLEQFLRPSETKKPVGSIPLMVGSIVAYAAFDYKIATTAILMITVGEFAANLMRIRLYRFKEIKRKRYFTYPDFVELAVNMLIGFLMLGNWTVALPMAFVATLVEAMSFRINDNLTVPVTSGFVGQVIKWLIL